MRKVIDSLKYIMSCYLIVANSLLFADHTTFDITLNNDSGQKLSVVKATGFSTSNILIPKPNIILEELIVCESVTRTPKENVDLPSGNKTEIFVKLDDIDFSKLTDFVEEQFIVQRLDIIEGSNIIGRILFKCSLLNTHPIVVTEAEAGYTFEDEVMSFGGGGMHFVIKKQ